MIEPTSNDSNSAIGPHAILHFERTIDASHQIPNHPGKCARLHGHTYRFQVWVSGPVNPETGMVIDFFDLKNAIDEWDHRHLNDLVDFIPTAELLADEMRNRLLTIMRTALPAAAHERVGVLLRLWETPNGYAEVGWLTKDPAAPAG